MATKINNITIEKIKSIISASIELNGCNLIACGCNGSGKTTLLSEIIRIIRNKGNELCLRQGESNGLITLELSDGNTIRYKVFKKDGEVVEQIQLVDRLGKSQNKPFSFFIDKYIGTGFEMDKFINSQPAEKKKIIERLIGIDLSAIDTELKIVRDKRTAKNNELKAFREVCPKNPSTITVKKPDFESLKSAKKDAEAKHESEISKIKAANDVLRMEFEAAKEKELQEILAYNKEQSDIKENFAKKEDDFEKICNLLHQDSVFTKFFDFTSAQKMLATMPHPKEQKPTKTRSELIGSYNSRLQPEVSDKTPILLLEKDVEQAYTDLQTFNQQTKELQDYQNLVAKGLKTRDEHDLLNAQVDELETKKLEIIKTSALPEGFSFGETEILYNGLPLTKESQSLSGLYIAALKLSVLGLKDLKYIAFDASPLDYKSIAEVEAYCNSIELQIGVERPSLIESELVYEVTENFVESDMKFKKLELNAN